MILTAAVQEVIAQVVIALLLAALVHQILRMTMRRKKSLVKSNTSIMVSNCVWKSLASCFKVFFLIHYTSVIETHFH